MSLVLIYGCRKPVIRVGRFAGQYAKPRSGRDGDPRRHHLPSYRGPLINGPASRAEERTPRPAYLLEGYHRAALTINFIRGLVDGGFADLHHPEFWNVDFVHHAAAADDYLQIVESISAALHFMETAAGRQAGRPDPRRFLTPATRACTWTTSRHKRGKSRGGPTSGTTSAPISPGSAIARGGLDGAHVEYFRGIANPIGVKLGPSMTPERTSGTDRRSSIRTSEPGRLTLIHRFGVQRDCGSACRRWSKRCSAAAGRSSGVATRCTAIRW